MNAQELYNRADVSGREAVENLTVEPMYVYTSKSLFSDEPDLDQPVYKVDDGPCGFASINLKPANSRFAKWLRAEGLAEKRYGGPGVSIWVGQYNQSYEKKSAYARAFAQVLRENDIHAWVWSALD